VALFTPARRVFGAVVDALGLGGGDGVLSKIDLAAAIPTFSTQASVESGQVRHSEFVLLRTDVGAVVSTVDIMPHVLGDWTEIRNRNRTLVAIVGSAVPPEHDAWITYVGLQVTVDAALDNGSVFRASPTVGAGNADVELWFGDTALAGKVFRAATHEPSIMVPLPWYIPPVSEQTSTLRFRLDSNAAGSFNLTLGVLSAPRGVLRRLY